MASTCDRAQYGNVKGLSVQHYLVKMLHQILLSLDQSSQSESFAVIMSMIDWSKAFDHQSHILGLQSFIDNGVRPAFIPILLSFFQDRVMKIKWNKKISSSRNLHCKKWWRWASAVARINTNNLPISRSLFFRWPSAVEHMCITVSRFLSEYIQIPIQGRWVTWNTNLLPKRWKSVTGNMAIALIADGDQKNKDLPMGRLLGFIRAMPDANLPYFLQVQTPY